MPPPFGEAGRSIVLHCSLSRFEFQQIWNSAPGACHLSHQVLLQNAEEGPGIMKLPGNFHIYSTGTDGLPDTDTPHARNRIAVNRLATGQGIPGSQAGKGKSVRDETVWRTRFFTVTKNVRPFSALLDAWVISAESGPDKRAARLIADDVRRCWQDPANTKLEISNFEGRALPPLPPHLTVLKVKNCRNIEEPPDLTRCSQLKELALSNTAIGVPPDVSGCPNLEKFDLSNCRRVQSAPDVTGCGQLKELNMSNSAITAPPDVSGCPSLEKFDLSNCRRVQAAPDVTGCGQLKELNMSNSAITAPPDVSRCPYLKKLDLGWTRIAAPPDVSQCPNLEQLNLPNCLALQVPPDVTACGQLKQLDMRGTSIAVPPDVSRCPNLERFDLGMCVRLQEAPDVTACSRLKVLNLEWAAIAVPPDVSRCEALESLYLLSCPQLSTLPDVAACSSLRRLNASGAPITSLPESILALPPTCTIWITASHLSDAVRNRLHAAMNAPGYTGPSIRYNMAAPAQEANVRPLADEVASWRTESGAAEQPGQSNWSSLTPEDAASLSNFLGRLRETSEYRNPSLQDDFRQRVHRLLDQLQHPENGSLREVCVALAHEATETCGDRVAMGLIHMETACAAHEAEADVGRGKFDGDPAALVKLGIGMYRLQELERMARAKHTRLRFSDEVEIYLGYVVKASKGVAGKALELPVQMNTMLYPACANVSETDASAAIEALTAGPDGGGHDPALLAYLAKWPPMNALLQRANPQEFGALQERVKAQTVKEQAACHAELEALDPDSADGDYKKRADEIMKRHDQLPDIIAVEEKRGSITAFLDEHGIAASLAA
ncbi:hypothetical protein EGT07_01140 [Herbaspirillum sp. HC18]|nr:hypothetical protein EGT07_01140 [Herbaspirillum sp. HC18]